MPTKAQESNLPLKEYKFTFRLDNRATVSTRYFLAYDARRRPPYSLSNDGQNPFLKVLLHKGRNPF